METVLRPGGAELHVEERGKGAPVVFAPYWSGHPTVFEGLLHNLAGDHRVITWDARGTGRSTRSGPYDIETDSSDLEAVVEQTGEPATIVSVADGMNRAVRVAARRPELVGAVVTMGTGPFARMHFAQDEGMVASDSVVAAFLKMLERDYRGALRTILRATNAQMSEDELRDRVALQLEYCPQEAAVARVRAWADDDPTEAARETGRRLWIFSAPDVAGPWLPPPERRRELVRTLTPEANLEEATGAEGPVSRPDVAAKRIRRITAAP